MENENSKVEDLLRKQLRVQRLILVAGILLVLLFGTLTYSIVKLAQEIEPAIASINSATESINSFAEGTAELMPALKEATDSISSVADSLNDEGLPKLYETLENLEGLKKLQNINIEQLNGAIESLYSVVEPLARLFGR